MNEVQKFQNLAQHFAKAVDDYQKQANAARLNHLRDLRRRIAVALLDLPSAAIQGTFAYAVPSVVNSCLRSGLRRYPRAQADDDLFARCLKAINPSDIDSLSAAGVAALLLARHAFELRFIPRLDSLQPVVRRIWLHLLCEMPSAFAKVGEADEFVLYLRTLCERFDEHFRRANAADADVVEAFNQSGMFVQVYFNELNLRDLMRARGSLIEETLLRAGANLDQLRVMQAIKRRPRVGFISLHVADNTETVFLAANIEHLDHSRYEVRLYSLQEASGNVGTRCRAWVEQYTRLPGNLEEAVVQLRLDDLDMVIFATNLTATNHFLTQIAAHRVAPIQITTMASPVTTGLRNIDVMISGMANETGESPEHYTERLVCLPGPVNCYAFRYLLESVPDPSPVSRATLGIPENCTVYFSASNFFKIVPELSQQWINILHQVPNSYLVLMPFNPNWSSQYPVATFLSRLAQQCSGLVDPQHIRLLNQVPTVRHLHKIIAVADVYLDAFPFSGACSIYDPLVAGIPVVARGGKVARARHSKAILEEEGLGDWVAADADSYVRAAVALGNDSRKRQVERERLAHIRGAGFRMTDTATYGAKLVATLDGVVADWNKRSELVQRADRAQQIARIAELAREIGRRQRSFTDRDLLKTVVLPYLRRGGSRRLIDVGACYGVMSKPFLEAGWQAVMFEPDTRCHPQIADLVNRHADRARLEKAAVVAKRNGTISFHVASLPGLSGLSASPFAPDAAVITVPSIALDTYLAEKGLDDVDFIKIDAEGHDFDILRGLDFGRIAPRLIMVEFGDYFAGQNGDAVAAVLRDMRTRGYRAGVVCLDALGEFKKHEWGTRLLEIGIDALPNVRTERGVFGNILFFRDYDGNFLPSLCDWLEQTRKWQAESASMAI